MKRFFLALMISAGLFTACDDDEVVEVKDYGLKSYEANLAYDSETPHGEVAYKQQVFLAFDSETPVAIGTYGTDTWTDFFLVTDTSAYNVTTDVTGWDLALTYYTEALEDAGETVPYGVAGVLINTENNIEVGKIEYTDSEEETAISEAFANLTLADISSVSYSSEINAIGYDWKSFSLAEMMYTVNSNWFYIVRLANDDVYKLRFTSFYGASTSERVIKFEYQLMQ